MKAEEIFEVIKKLTGDIYPVGDTTIDNQRRENIRLYIDVFDKMHTLLAGIAIRFRNSDFHSEKEIGRIAQQYFDFLNPTSSK